MFSSLSRIQGNNVQKKIPHNIKIYKEAYIKCKGKGNPAIGPQDTEGE
jgi:hypothetical protein